jgi:peptide/nickel transport system substrate-binding protein
VKRGLCAAATAGTLLAACRAVPPGPRPSVASPRTSEALVVALSAPPVSLDPHRQNEFVSFSVLSNVCEGLVSLDAWLRVEPALAASWTNPDDRHWRFELRRGVLFHDGSPLTSEDVVFSLDRARKHPQSQYASYLVDVDEVRALDNHTVEVGTARANPFLLQKLAFVLVVPRGSPATIEEPVGTGPYSLSQLEPGGTIVLRAFDRYWGAAPAEKEVRFQAVKRADAPDRLLSGEVDLVADLDHEAAGRVSRAGGFKVVARPAPSVDVLSLRVDAPPFSDPRVRRAAHLALDRDALVQELLSGFGRPASQLVSRNVFGFSPDIPVERRDLERARRLLAEAGALPELELEHRYERRAEPIVRQLREAGFRVRDVARSWHDLVDRFEKGQVTLGMMGLVSDSGESSDVFLSTLHTRTPEKGLGDSNDRGYSDLSLDALIESASRTPALGARQRLLQRCMAIAMDDLSLVPVVERYLIHGVREDVMWEERADGRILARDLRRLPQEP